MAWSSWLTHHYRAGSASHAWPQQQTRHRDQRLPYEAAHCALLKIPARKDKRYMACSYPLIGAANINIIKIIAIRNKFTVTALFPNH